jgi:hypothetical protein
MKFSNEVTLTGIKKSKGEFEGVAYDSTTFFILTDLDDRSGNGVGAATVSYKYGTSSEFDKYLDWVFPCQVRADFEVITSGKASQTVLLGVKLIS